MLLISTIFTCLSLYPWYLTSHVKVECLNLIRKSSYCKYFPAYCVYVYFIYIIWMLIISKGGKQCILIASVIMEAYRYFKSSCWNGKSFLLYLYLCCGQSPVCKGDDTFRPKKFHTGRYILSAFWDSLITGNLKGNPLSFIEKILACYFCGHVSCPMWNIPFLISIMEKKDGTRQTTLEKNLAI